MATKNVPLPEFLSEDAKSLLKELFKIKPKDRLGAKFGADEIKKHKFFAEINFEDLYLKKVKPPITFVENEINF